MRNIVAAGLFLLAAGIGLVAVVQMVRLYLDIRRVEKDVKAYLDGDR